MFYEVVIAPGYTPEGLQKLKGKSKTLRILEAKPRAPEGQSLRQIAGKQQQFWHLVRHAALTDAAVKVHSCLTFAAYLQCTSFAVNKVSIFANWYRILVGAVHLEGLQLTSDGSVLEVDVDIKWFK